MFFNILCCRFLTIWALHSLVVSFALASSLSADVKIIPGKVHIGPVTATYKSSASGIDAPKLSAINNTAWDWWYYDVVSPDLKYALVVVFFTSGDNGYIPGGDGNAVHARTWLSFPNGTRIDKYNVATHGVVTTDGDGSSGEWVGSGMSWEGTPDMRNYTILFNTPDIKGSFQINSVTSGRYPCGTSKANEDLLIGPNTGWSNAVPDGDGIVDLVVHGERMAFNGVAYHDKNWGDAMLFDGIKSWYWGHGRFGAHSVVWFSYLDRAGNEKISSFASTNGKIASLSCAPKSIVTRPTGSNSTFPPIANAFPDKFAVNITGGNGAGINAIATSSRFLEDQSYYKRWMGEVTGSVDNGPVLKGVGIWEAFQF